MSEQTCGNCRWWWRATKTNGVCRRHPPQVCDDGARWPEIIAKGWCGEWADKAITPDQEQRRELVRRFAVAILTRHGDTLAPHDVWRMAAEMADAEMTGERMNYKRLTEIAEELRTQLHGFRQLFDEYDPESGRAIASFDEFISRSF